MMTNEYMFNREYSEELRRKFLLIAPISCFFRKQSISLDEFKDLVKESKEDNIMPCGKKVKPPKK